MEHKHSPKEERRIREEALDETIAESFPASDPPSTLPNPDYDETPRRGDEQDESDERPRKPGEARASVRTLPGT